MDTFLAAPGTEILPGYRVVGLLGHGGRVDTYDVHSERRRCRCVVKILRPDRADDVRAGEAVVREGELLRDLAHPHLLRGYDVVCDPRPAMVLETQPGATLQALLDEGPLAPADVAHLGVQLGGALHYLHGQGWLHLDVKPANVVVDGGRAVLIDLSLAARPGPGRAGAGTDGYLAPEQVTGAQLGAAADVWGLGVTLVEALAGGDPVGIAVPDRRLRPAAPLERAVRALDGVPAVSRTVRRLLLACLDPDPGARPGMAEVHDVLAAVVEDDGRPGAAAPGVPGPPGLTGPGAPRTRWWARRSRPGRRSAAARARPTRGSAAGRRTPS